jgi:hypothetical protein
MRTYIAASRCIRTHDPSVRVVQDHTRLRLCGHWVWKISFMQSKSSLTRLWESIQFVVGQLIRCFILVFMKVLCYFSETLNVPHFVALGKRGLKEGGNPQRQSLDLLSRDILIRWTLSDDRLPADRSDECWDSALHLDCFLTRPYTPFIMILLPHCTSCIWRWQRDGAGAVRGSRGSNSLQSVTLSMVSFS